MLMQQADASRVHRVALEYFSQMQPPRLAREAPPRRSSHNPSAVSSPADAEASSLRALGRPIATGAQDETPQRTATVAPSSTAPRPINNRLAWNGRQKSEQAEPTQSVAPLVRVSPNDSSQSPQSNLSPSDRNAWSCFNVRGRHARVTSSDSLQHPQSVLSKPSILSNDTSLHCCFARLPRVLLNTFLGVPLVSWIVLVIFFGGGIGLVIYLWMYFIALVRELTHERFGSLCYSQARIFSLSMSTCLDTQQELANEPAFFIQSKGAFNSEALTHHFQGGSRPFSTLHFFKRIESAADRASFEAERGSSILAWDATSGTLVSAGGSSITGGPLDGSFFPAILRIAPGDAANSGIPSGFALPELLDLASLPGFPAVLQALLNSNGTAQVSHVQFVANYSAPTREDGCASTDPLAQRVWLATEDADAAPKKLLHSAGYRMLMLSASYNVSTASTSPSGSIRGVMLSSFDLTPILHSIRFAPMAYRSIDAAHLAQLVDVNIPSMLETAVFRIKTRGASPKQVYHEQNAGLVYWSQNRQSSRYVDADTACIDSVDIHSEWNIGMYLNNPSLAMDWSFGCTASPVWLSHFSQLDNWRRVLGSIFGAFILLVTCLAYVLMRWNNTERVHKNASITQMHMAIHEAEMARDQKTDFMAFLCHELRNPLHAVLSMSDCLQGTVLDEDQAESVFTIHASSELMLAITNDILDLSKIEVGKIELDLVEIDLVALVYSLVRANNAHAAEKGIQVVGKLGSNVPRYIRADPTRINQMLSNLISNAVKFSKKHASVRLEVEVVEGGKDEAGAEVASRHTAEGLGQATVSGCDKLEVLKQDVRDLMRAGRSGEGNISPKSEAHPSVAGVNASMIRPRMTVHHQSLSQLDVSHAGSEGRATMSRQDSFSRLQLQQQTMGNPVAVPGVLLESSQLDLEASSDSPPTVARPSGLPQADSVDMGLDRRYRRIVKPVEASRQFDMITFSARPLERSPGGRSSGSLPHVADLRTIAEKSPSSVGIEQKIAWPGVHVAGQPSNAPSPPARSGHVLVGSRVSSPGLHSPAFSPMDHTSAPHPTPLLAPTQRLGHISPIPHRRELKLKRQTPTSVAIANEVVTSPTTPQTSLGHVRLAFRVSDAGCGISSDYIPVLFEPYTQAKRSITRSHGGTGLGLAIVKKLCDLMDATITVDSKVNVGTIFTITANFETAATPSASIAMLMQELPGQQVMQSHQVRFTNYTSMTVPRGTPQMEVAPSLSSPQVLPMMNISPFVPSLPVAMQPWNGSDAGVQPQSSDRSWVSRDLYPIPSPNSTDGSEYADERAWPREQEPVSSAMNMPRRHNVDSTMDTLPSSVSDGSDMPQPMLPVPSAVVFEALPPAALVSYTGSSLSTDASEHPVLRGDMSVELARRRLHKTGFRVPLQSQTGPLQLSPKQQPLLISPRRSQGMQPMLPQNLARVQVYASSAASSSTTAPASDLSPNSGGTGVPEPTSSPFSPFSPCSPVPSSADGSRPIVLVVDDAAINRKIMHKALISDYDLDMAENGLEAVQMVEANPGRYCCVLMDLMMPVLSGTEALVQIRAKGHTMPVIAVTANTMQQDVTLCLRLGFSAFLSKPCRKETIRAKIKELRAATATEAAAASPVGTVAASPSAASAGPASSSASATYLTAAAISGEVTRPVVVLTPVPVVTAAEAAS